MRQIDVGIPLQIRGQMPDFRLDQSAPLQVVVGRLGTYQKYYKVSIPGMAKGVRGLARPSVNRIRWCLPKEKAGRFEQTFPRRIAHHDFVGCLHAAIEFGQHYFAGGY
jgi:hypothetical protein